MHVCCQPKHAKKSKNFQRTIELRQNCRLKFNELLNYTQMNINMNKLKIIAYLEPMVPKYNGFLIICKFSFIIFSLSLFLRPIVSYGEDWPSLTKSNAEFHPIIHEGPLTNPYESLIIGNGDLAISAQMFSHQLLLRIGKNDVWDSRSELKTEENILTQDKLIELNGNVDNLFDFNLAHRNTYVGGTRQGPTPKPVGVIKITHGGLSNTKVVGKVDIANGILTVEYGFPEGKLIAEVFLHKGKNSIITKYTAEGKIPWIIITVEKQPDYVDSEIPDPEIKKGSSDRQWTISQTIKSKYDVPDFSWHIGCMFPGATEKAEISQILKWRYALEQRITLQDGASVVMSMGVATDRDGIENSLDRALQLASVTNLIQYREEKINHSLAWQSFWDASSINIEDKELEALWYRTLFGFACHLKPGAQAPGINANIPIFDYSAWNGDNHWNHNVQKWYFPALATNHLEWYEVFAKLVEQNIPVFEHLAKSVFNLNGVYVDLYTFPFVPAKRAMTYSTNGRALSHTGWISQMLFQHYEFTNDSVWLKKNAYTYLSKAADFYANYLDKYQKDDKVIFPSMLLEDTPKWEEGFPQNRNVLTDLVMFRKAFESAIEASIVLNLDINKRKRWEQHLTNIPNVAYGWKEEQGWFAIYKDWQLVWPDFNDYLHHLRTSRWGCSGWLVFPGEYIDGDERDGLTLAVRDVLLGTDLLNLPDKTRKLGTFHGEANFLPFIRMGIMEKFDDIRTILLNHRFASGQFSPFSTGENIYVTSPSYASWRIVENQYFPILGITEMLLQSQGNIIRLFPYWPLDKSASFSTLRARNGFIISAAWDPKIGMFAKIKSLKGNNCRIRWEGKKRPLITLDNDPVSFNIEGRDIVFETLPDAEYELRY